MSTKQMKVTAVKVGDRVETTAGMRTVVAVNRYDSFMSITVNDPAAGRSTTVLDYPLTGSVTVERKS